MSPKSLISLFSSESHETYEASETKSRMAAVFILTVFKELSWSPGDCTDQPQQGSLLFRLKVSLSFFSNTGSNLLKTGLKFTKSLRMTLNS